MSGPRIDRAACEALDAADPLAQLRDRFAVPPGIYVDGNSLGAQPRGVAERVGAELERWAAAGVGGWNRGWLDLAGSAAGKLAPLLGTDAGGLSVGDSTSVNLFKAAMAAMAAAGSGDVLGQVDDFPTDMYVLEAAARLAGRRVRRVPRERLAESIGAGVALVAASHVDYRTGHLLDMAAVTERAHAAGALALWDLCHSAGALPVHLDACGADFAAGCTYKFLNGGPGSPAFVHAARRHVAALDPAIPGWFGHRDTFAFATRYEPAEGAGRLAAGTPAVLSLVALDAALDAWAGVDLELVRAKSLALGDVVGAVVDAAAPGTGLARVTPREPALRGSQVAFRHPSAPAVAAALVERGVVPDCRPPDILRIGLTPLYLRHVDAFDAATALVEVAAATPAGTPAPAGAGRVP